MVRGALFAAVVALALPTVADTDLWGHLRFGLDAIRDGYLHSRDPYSFTSDRPWINHEWLAEMGMGLSYRLGGSAGLLALKGVVVAIALIISGMCVSLQRRHTWRSDALLGFVGIVGILPLTLTLRPQVFSVLLFVILLTSIRHIDAGRQHWLWFIPMVFLIWANTHGGWMVGGATLAIWTVVTVLESRHSLRWKCAVTGMGLLAAAGTLVNPYGLGLWQFLFETVGFSRSDIGEWSPLTVHRELLITWFATTGLFAAALMTRTGWRWSHLLIGLFLAYASFRVARLGPFYSLSVGLLLGPALLTSTGDRTDASPPVARFSGAVQAAIPFALVILLVVTLNRSALSCVRPHPAVGLDLTAAEFIRLNQLSGRMVAWFNWGEFLIWHFAPQLKVSIDGRRETVYSAETLDAHQRLWRAEPGAEQYLASLQPDYVWIPQSLPLNSTLTAWGWTAAFSTQESTVWSRHAMTFDTSLNRTPDPCFPALQNEADLR